MAHLKGTLDHLAERDVRSRASPPGCARTTSRSPSRAPRWTCVCFVCRGASVGNPDRAVPHVQQRGLDRVGRLRHGQPAGARRLRHRPRAYSGFAFGMGIERTLMFRNGAVGHARHGRGRRPLHRGVRDGGLMRAPRSAGWPSHVDLPAGLTPRELADALIRTGLEVERSRPAPTALSGPIVVGRVLSFDDEPQKNGKTIRWCQVDVGEAAAARHRLRRAQLRRRRPGRRRPARRGAARRVRDRARARPTATSPTG